MAAAPSSLWEGMREELTCSICLDLLTRPKVLPCQHTFCQDCLQDLAGNKRHFKCQNCHQEVSLPSKGVAGLRDNQLVINLCERLQTQSGNRCSFHPSEEVRLYCKLCNVPVCNECMDEMHCDHVIISLKKASRDRKAPAQVLINKGRNILEVYCGFLKSLREKENTLDEQKQETDNSIIQAFNIEVQKFTEKKDHLLFQVEEKYKKNKELAQEERDRVLTDVDELCAAFNQAEEEMEQGGVESLSQGTSILTEVVEMYRRKAVIMIPVRFQTAVFQPADTPRPVLGHLTDQSLPKTITFGEEGSGNGQFQGLSGVTVSEEGEIFVADGGNQRIQVFTLQETFVRQFPTVVPPFFLLSFFLQYYGQTYMNPHDVALDGEGNLWVVGHTCACTLYAVHYTKQGRALKKIELLDSDCHCLGVAVDTRRNHILITLSTGDWGNKYGEVQVFRPDGALVTTVGRTWMYWFPSQLRQWMKSLLFQRMEMPNSITVDDEGKIFVSDWLKHCIYVFNEDGQFLFHFQVGRQDDEDWEGGLLHPHGVCTDRSGNIIVAGGGVKRIWTDRSGNSIVAGGGVESVNLYDKTGRFLQSLLVGCEVNDIAIGPQGQLVVTEENTVQIIEYTTETN